MGNAHSAMLMPASISIRGSLRPIRGSPSRRRITSRTSSTEILGNGFGADNIQLSSVHIDVYDMVRSANSLSEFSRDITATAPGVKAPHSRADAYFVQEIKCARLENVAQNAQPFTARLPP